jgi:hypothetical protein
MKKSRKAKMMNFRILQMYKNKLNIIKKLSGNMPGSFFVNAAEWRRNKCLRKAFKFFVPSESMGGIRGELVPARKLRPHQRVSCFRRNMRN